MTIELYNAECVGKMSEFSPDTFEMVITSPPYNVGVSYGEKTDDLKSLDEYSLFAKSVMREVSRVLKTGGRACIEIGGGGRDFPLSHIWQGAAYGAGLGLYAEIGIEHRKTNPTAWGSYLKADMVRPIPNFHLLYVFYKGQHRKTGAETMITKEEFVEWTRGYWKINWSIGSTKDHPAQFPVELPERCLKLFGHKGDNVLDPMMGSGTTGIACFRLERNFTGIEIEEKYFKLARNRINLVANQLSLFGKEEELANEEGFNPEELSENAL